jgi:transitional endoplasmic reticulum ATPase
VIEIVGKRSTAARAIRPYGEDEGLDIIRLDGLQRANAGVGSGDFVEVRKANPSPRRASSSPRRRTTSACRARPRR